MLLQTDTKLRITLPTNTGIKPGDALKLEIQADGRIMLIPVEVIPKHQLWAWTTNRKTTIETSMTDPLPPTMIDTFEDEDDVAMRWTDDG